MKIARSVFTFPLAVAALLGAAVPAAQAAPAADRTHQGGHQGGQQAGHHGGKHGGQPQGPAECRGQGVDSEALIRYESDIVIDAPLSTIWKAQTDVERWPSWQPAVLTSTRFDHGPLRRGSQFRWTTPAPSTPSTPATTLSITSTVKQLKPGSCVLWSGPAVGAGLTIDEGVHLWTFEKVRGGVRVHTEETWTGDQVEADIPTATWALGEGLEVWLSDLKAEAEARACGRSRTSD